MSAVSQLGERLKAQIQHDQEAIEGATSDALKAHEASLKRLSSDALNTTRTAIKSESDMLIQSIKKARSLTDEHTSRLPHLLMMSMLLPIAATIALCALMIGLTWIYLPMPLFSATTETWTMQTQRGPAQAIVITSPGWTVCTDKSGQQRPCKFQ